MKARHTRGAAGKVGRRGLVVPSKSIGIDDDGGPLGIRVETSATGAIMRVVATRPTFVLPFHASIFVVSMRGLVEGSLLDAGSWLLVPQGQSARLETRSPTATVAVLSLHDELRRRVRQVYDGEIDDAVMRRLLSKPTLAPRTIWVNEIAQRYAFERGVCRRRDNAATTFLEVEILKEWYFVRRDVEEVPATRRSHLDEGRPLFERARGFIDGNLAADITVALLAKELHASSSAVLRAFRQGAGVGPASYLRGRRLDEALLLLRSAKYPVGEVATRVGYVSFSAFSQAFRTRFGKAPSSFVP